MGGRGTGDGWGRGSVIIKVISLYRFEIVSLAFSVRAK